MDQGNTERLTRNDFYCINPFLPYDLFACPDCKVDTASILRHSEFEYIAEFQCRNVLCRRKEKWYKCRLCTHKRKIFKKPSDHLRNTQIHQQCLQAFEKSRSQEYIACEHHRTKIDPPATPIEHPFRPSATDRDSLAILDQEVYSDSLSECNNSFGYEPDEELPSHDEHAQGSDTHIPKTVTEWKKLFIQKSPPAPCHNLSRYFPVADEPTPIKGHTRRPSNREYFQYNSQLPGYGPRLIVAKGVVKNSDRQTVELVSPENALWCMLLAYLSHKLTTSDQEILVAILDYVQNHQRQQSYQQNSDNTSDRPTYLALPVPRSQAELRNNFGNGRRSIPEVLPRPIIQRLDGGFAYVSIRDILQYHLANGQTMDPLINMRYSDASMAHALHGSSPRGIELVSITGILNLDGVCKFPAEVTIWSDGFDPNSTKRNRGSAHILLVSIGTPQDDYHSGRNTYPVSIGPADGDTTIVSGKVADELADLFDECSTKNVFFDSTSKKELSVFLRVYCFLQDRPERCAWLKLAYGNGKYAGRFGWTADLSQKRTLSLLPSCQRCKNWRLNNPSSRRSCKKCLDWCMEGMVFEVPENYPTVFKPVASDVGAGLPATAPEDPCLTSAHCHGRYLPCHKIKVADLPKACKAAFDMVRLGKWSKKEGKAYLETQGLSPEFGRNICDTAYRIKKTGTDEPMPKTPKTWEIPGVDICDHIDVPMHLCFLGITKANSAELVNEWLKSRRQATSFKKKSAVLLEKIRKLSLSWCQVETKFGGYVSENWVAYCRISPYMHSLLWHLDTNDDEDYRDPDVPLREYHWREKKAWLLARHIPGITKKSLKKDIEETFEFFLSLPEDELPPIVEAVVSDATIDVVAHLVICWHVCMCRIMSISTNLSDDQVADVDRHIKLFLSSVEDFDVSRRDGEARKNREKERNSTNKRSKKEPSVIVPVWRRKPNYLGLLNVPETMRKMGPIRVLTELDEKGERGIGKVKPLIKQGMKGNWAYNTMFLTYLDRSFIFALKDALRGIGKEAGSHLQKMIQVATKLAAGKVHMDSSEDTASGGDQEGDGSDPSPTRFKRYQTFKNRADALGSIRGDDPISGVVFRGRFYLVIKGSETDGQSILEVEPKKWRKQVCGADYFWWEHVQYGEEETLSTNDVQRMVNEAPESFLLLPDISRADTEGVGGKSFCLISSEWRNGVRSDENENGFALQLPTIPEAAYHRSPTELES